MKSKTVKFLAEIPAEVDARLRKEAEAARRSRLAQLARILEERYGLAPEEVTQPQGEAQPQAA